ncbi:NUDIX domain-containing protein [Floricoccus penangensis]|uniref:NUDIX domain-containing protein n=1 Tax=Floricoccus penangensis TaxID=1859475 RepID=UPI002041B2BF|nr:NUDIX domain-containing protein [Floricoccus penangensis]URZ87640.1 NUDIX domain-containing protein [Floricoccus penangensis]
MSKGVFNIIVRDERILLVKRRDLPLWDLPGGHLDPEESEFDCAIREAYEETGLIVKPKYLIGKYVIEELDDIQFVYKSKIESGELIESGPETKELRYFNINSLPLFMVPNRRQQIKDFQDKNENKEVMIKEKFLIRLLRKIL